MPQWSQLHIVNNKNKITGKKCQPLMSVTGINDQGLRWLGCLLWLLVITDEDGYRNQMIQPYGTGPPISSIGIFERERKKKKTRNWIFLLSLLQLFELVTILGCIPFLIPMYITLRIYYWVIEFEKLMSESKSPTR